MDVGVVAKVVPAVAFLVPLRQGRLGILRRGLRVRVGVNDLVLGRPTVEVYLPSGEGGMGIVVACEYVSVRYP